MGMKRGGETLSWKRVSEEDSVKRVNGHGIQTDSRDWRTWRKLQDEESCDRRNLPDSETVSP